LRHNYGMTHTLHYLIPFLVVAFIYLAVAVDFWREAKSVHAEQSLKLHSMMIILGLMLHGWLLYQGIFANGFNLGFYYALSVILWLTVLIYWFADITHKLTSLQAFVLPPAAIFAVLPAFMESNHFLPSAESPIFMWHIAIALLAYSLFTFAALHVLLMAIVERSLHHRTTFIKLPNFPPLMVMENLLFKIITLGFILLTITLVSGMLFSEQIFGKPLQFNHKTVFSFASWVIYAGLLFGRFQYGWRGAKAIRWTLVGFVLLMLAYIGSKFILQVLLQR